MYEHDPGLEHPPELENRLSSRNKCKGIGRAAARALSFEQYKQMVEEGGDLKAAVTSIRAFDHTIFKLTTHKRALSSMDDKFFWLCAEHAVPYDDIVIKYFDGENCPHVSGFYAGIKNDEKIQENARRILINKTRTKAFKTTTHFILF